MNYCLLSVCYRDLTVTRLPPLEILRRQHGAYTEEALLLANNYRFGTDGFCLSRLDAEELATRLRVGISIITYNANYFRALCQLFLALRQSFREQILQKKGVAAGELALKSKQMTVALEFYLQMDGEYRVSAAIHMTHHCHS